MKFKKIIASVLVAVTLCGAVSVNTFGAQIDIGDIGDLTYDPAKSYEFKLKDDGTYEITKHKGIEDTMGFTYTVDIPSTYNGKPVTSIGEDAFGATASVRYDNIEKIIIHDGITSIGTWAFAGMAKLSEVTIPSSVKYIGENIFKDTPFLEAKRAVNPLVIINNILIDGRTVAGNVVIPDEVTCISEFAFSRNEKIESVSIPDSINDIPAGAFADCKNLKTVKLPDKLTSIGNYAFDGCSITEITLPKSLKSIGDMAFYSNDITSVNIPSGVNAINNSTFGCCKKLKTVNIPNSVKTIGTGAFRECRSLKSIVIPESVSEINKAAFRYAMLNNITIKNSKCVIYDAPDTIYYSTIHGYSGSTAESYAKKYSKNFVSLNDCLGDVNEDGKVNIRDAAFITIKLAKGLGNQLPDCADYNKDGKRNVRDAAAIAIDCAKGKLK